MPTPRLVLAILAAALAAGAAAAAPDAASRTAPSGAADERVWFEAGVPGGVAPLLSAAGLDPATERWRALYALARKEHASFSEYGMGMRSAHELRAYFDALAPGTRRRGPQVAALGSARANGPEPAWSEREPPDAAARPRASEAVPLPLSPELWSRHGLERRVLPGAVVAAMLSDRAASQLYLGLAALDDETLRALAREPDTLKRLRRGPVETFSVFARSFRVRDGRVDVPGGAAALPLWEKAVGEQAARPGRFLVQLMALEEGALAYLYDTLARLDDAHLRFALGPPADATGREQRLDDLRGVFARVPWWWRSGGRPYSRSAPDPAHVLALVPVTDDGRLAAPGERGFWEAAFDGDGLPSDPADELRQRSGSGLPTAEWLAERIGLADPPLAQARLERLAYAARLYAGAPADAHPAMLFALRAHGRYRTLLLALERMGVAEPALQAALVRRAAALTGLPAARAEVGLLQFEGALALLDRARATRVLDAQQARDLVSSLARVEPEGEGRYRGAVARWLEGELLPVLARATYGDVAHDSVERVVLRALSGAVLLPAVPPPVIDWEGLRYTVDVGGAEFARLTRVREAQGGPSLESVLAFCKSAGALASRRPHPGGDARALAAEYGRLREGLSVPADLAALERKETLAAPDTLTWAGDVLLADVLRSLAYAPHLGAPDGPVLAGENVARRHALDLAEAGRGAERGPWSLPREMTGAGVRWHVRGSLLALDVGLARFGLRRLSNDLPAHAPMLHGPDREAFGQAVALLNPWALTDPERDALVEAVKRGRARVAAAAGDAALLDTLAAEARVAAWRRRGLAWLLAHEPEALDGFFSLYELYRLGGGEGGAGWGAPRLSTEGSLLVGLAPSYSDDDLVGLPPQGLMPAVVPDLNLRVAEGLFELKLPAALGPGVLSAAVVEFADEAQPAYPEDRLALAHQARALSRERIEDFVSALAAGGPLLAVEEEEDQTP